MFSILDFFPVSFDALFSLINRFLFFSSKTILLGVTVIISECNLFLRVLLLHEIDGFGKIIIKTENKLAESLLAVSHYLCTYVAKDQLLNILDFQISKSEHWCSMESEDQSTDFFRLRAFHYISDCSVCDKKIFVTEYIEIY